MSAATSADCIDLNSRAASSLEAFSHVGPARAEDIIEGRLWQAWKELTTYAASVRGV